MSVDHYENFPVASWLCPPRLRPAIRAIYHFARTADDLADEGHASAAERLEQLSAYRHALRRLWNDQGAAPGVWFSIFHALDTVRQIWHLPRQPFEDLLDAFERDARGLPFEDRQALLDYAHKSAAPIGRLLLHLYGIDDEPALSESDDICVALQLINFWQDIREDLERGRCNLPLADLRAIGLHLPIQAKADRLVGINQLLPEWAAWSRSLMQRGCSLVHRIPGRIGWELRFVIQGGLLILDKLARDGHDTRKPRVLLRQWDGLTLIFRACRMSLQAQQAV